MRKKSGDDDQVVQGAAHPIWQVKQRWARRFDPARAKILIFKKILLQKMERKIFASLFVKEIFWKSKFWPSGNEPKLPNLPDRTGGTLGHMTIASGLSPIGDGNGL